MDDSTGLYLAEMIDGAATFTSRGSYDDLPAGAMERTEAAQVVDGTRFELYAMPDVPMDVLTVGWKRFLHTTSHLTIRHTLYRRMPDGSTEVTEYTED